MSVLGLPLVGKSPDISIMVKALMKASRSLIHDFNEVEHLQVSRKGPGNFVSQADIRSEKIIKEVLKKGRPDYGFLMEESGSTGDSDLRWIVDPLDGTTNFLHSLPHFGISIALEKKGVILCSAILDPIRNELFWAEKGKGAYLNKTKLSTSGRTSLKDSLIAFGRGIDPHKITPSLEGACTRHWGAASLDLAYIAAGRHDGFISSELAPWDVAAAYLIVKEAGGIITDWEAKPYNVDNPTNILASNKALHSLLHKVL